MLFSANVIARIEVVFANLIHQLGAGDAPIIAYEKMGDKWSDFL